MLYHGRTNRKEACMGEIWVTGDTHGDPFRLSSSLFPVGRLMDRNDIIEVLGDFGLVWDYTGESG